MSMERHIAAPARLSARERVVERLSDLLFQSDDVLDILQREDAAAMKWIEPHVRNVYAQVDDVMRRLCD